MKRANGFRRTHPGDEGSATVIMLGVIGAVLTLTVSGLLLTSAVLASHRARTAADLGALAAAGALMRGESPGAACQIAASVASANHGQMQACAATGPEVRVTIAVQSRMHGLGVATARSRAGPASARDLSPSR